MRAFFDTNILVYLYDNDAPEKKRKAQSLLLKAAEAGQVLLSTQVMQEFYVSVTRKLAEPLPPVDAERAVRRLADFAVVQVDPSLIFTAIATSRRYGFSFWDALIVQAAIQGGAATLYSEDLQHTQLIDGMLILNPFA
jgi:predicted nucleic acid-binding protein